MNQHPIALIYRFKLLPFSETFILNQAERLQHFQAHYLGLRSIPGIQTPVDRTTIINPRENVQGKARELHFKLLGHTAKLRSSPAFIHAHFADDGAIVLPFANRLQVPLVVTCHGYDVLSKPLPGKESLGYRLYRQRRTQLKQDAKLFITVSDFLQKKLLQQGFPEDKVIRHYVGIDTQKFQPDRTVKREAIVLFTGRLAETKGCDYLLRAMADVQRQLPEMKLVVIGDGSLRSELERQAKATLKNYVFLGAQTSEVVKSWMSRARVFCVPSVTGSCGDVETFGMVFLKHKRWDFQW